jgi:ribonuclease VapC
MVVETSAVLAILLDEPEAAEFAQLIEDDPAPLISAASMLELTFRTLFPGALRVF